MTASVIYGVCVGSDETFGRFTAPSLERLGATGRTIKERDPASIFAAYNRILNAAAGIDDLGALVLLHDDIEIRDDEIERKVLDAVANDDVAVVGVVGSRGSQTMKTWSGQRLGRIESTYGVEDFGGGSHDVELVDGLLMVLSPWAVRNLRFDEVTYTGFHGYDADICQQATAAGRVVRVAEIDIYHHCKTSIGDSVAFHRAGSAYRRKWGLTQESWHVRIRREHPSLERSVKLCKSLLRR